jgi:hypothetical protein
MCYLFFLEVFPAAVLCVFFVFGLAAARAADPFLSFTYVTVGCVTADTWCRQVSHSRSVKDRIVRINIPIFLVFHHYVLHL